MDNDNDLISQQLATGTSRRQVLKRLGMGAVGLAGLNLLASRVKAATTTLSAQDAAILQFALNLEYLEAQYYTFALTGHGVNPVLLTGSGTMGPVVIKSNPSVPFTTPAFRQYGAEIYRDETAHVSYIRQVLRFFGVEPVAQPKLDLLHSFNTLARAAGIGSSFDPFANEANFILGAFIFEDVGVTAYKGAAPLIENNDILAGAAGLLGTEAYHAANIRTTIFNDLGATAISIAQKISDLRDQLDGVGNDDQGVTDGNGKANITPTDDNALVFGRTTRQVLNIVYGAPGAHSGLFFPNGLNGPIR